MESPISTSLGALRRKISIWLSSNTIEFKSCTLESSIIICHSDKSPNWEFFNQWSILIFKSSYDFFDFSDLMWCLENLEVWSIFWITPVRAVVGQLEAATIILQQPVQLAWQPCRGWGGARTFRACGGRPTTATRCAAPKVWGASRVCRWVGSKSIYFPLYII